MQWELLPQGVSCHSLDLIEHRQQKVKRTESRKYNLETWGWQQGGNKHILQPDISEELYQTAEDNWFIKSVSHLESSTAKDCPHDSDCDGNVQILDWKLHLKYIGSFEHSMTILKYNMYHILLWMSGIHISHLSAHRLNFPSCVATKPLLSSRSGGSGFLLANDIACTSPSRGFLGHLKCKGISNIFSSAW